MVSCFNQMALSCPTSFMATSRIQMAAFDHISKTVLYKGFMKSSKINLQLKDPLSFSPLSRSPLLPHPCHAGKSMFDPENPSEKFRIILLFVILVLFKNFPGMQTVAEYYSAFKALFDGSKDVEFLLKMFFPRLPFLQYLDTKNKEPTNERIVNQFLSHQDDRDRGVDKRLERIEGTSINTELKIDLMKNSLKGIKYILINIQRENRILSASDLHDPGTSALIAAKMKEFHDLNMPAPKNVLLWNRLRNWLSTAKRISSSSKEDPFCLAAMEEEITPLESRCSGDYLPVGFCHNNLQYGNIMMDEVAKSITIIDYEYACYNPVAFDIANHFCEMAADYHTETPHLLDYTKYPGVEERRRFLCVYLSCSGVQPSDTIIEQCLQEVEKYTLASHLFWGLWGIISAHVNEIDFDYLEYARQRFQLYWKMKSELFGSSGSATT